eukprot:scaffold130743_cov48-Phaeocystis_antarctica.AAC.2
MVYRFTPIFAFLPGVSLSPQTWPWAQGPARGTTRSRQRPPTHTPRFVPTPPRRHRPPKVQEPR